MTVWGVYLVELFFFDGAALAAKPGRQRTVAKITKNFQEVYLFLCFIC